MYDLCSFVLDILQYSMFCLREIVWCISTLSELLAAPCSDLSFEQILQDDPMPLTPLSLPEEEEGEDEDLEEEEEEELPSILERSE